MSGLLMPGVVTLFLLPVVGSLWGLLGRRRSGWFIPVGLLAALPSGLGALHAWGESRSAGWTAAYGVVAAVGLACIVRQLLPRRRPPR